MSRESAHELSVIVITPDDYETVRETVRRLRAQTVREKLELLIVAPSAAGLDLDASELECFGGWLVVEVGEFTSTGRARAAGVRRSSAPVVALAEEHCYPAPGWAGALIERHREGWAAVGPVVANANPRGATSWANFLISFAPWAEPRAGGEADSLPWHNSSYKRALLWEYGDALGEVLEAEGLIHRDLRAKGHRLYVEPAAGAEHLNITRAGSYLREQFHAGRRFAAARSRRESWSPSRRALYTFGTAVTPALKLRDVWREVSRRRAGLPELPSRVWPALAVGLAAHAAGEMAGYAFGAGDSYRRSSELEFHHLRHLASPGGDGRVRRLLRP